MVEHCFLGAQPAFFGVTLPEVNWAFPHQSINKMPRRLIYVYVPACLSEDYVCAEPREARKEHQPDAVSYHMGARNPA